MDKKNIIRKNDNHKSLLKKCYYLILYMVYWFIIKFFLKNKVIFVTNLAYNMSQLCLDLRKKNNQTLIVAYGKYFDHMGRICSLLNLLLNRFNIKKLNIQNPIDLIYQVYQFLTY